MGEAVAIFAETNLGTCLAVSVHPDITAAQLTAKIEREHFHCFHDIGNIKIGALQIKKGSHLYSLSHEAVVKHFFKELTTVWFLHVNAFPIIAREKASYLLDDKPNHEISLDLETSNEKVSILQNSSGIFVGKEDNSIRKKINMKGFHKRKWKEKVVQPSGLKFGKIEVEEASSGKVSKTGIGKRFVRAVNSVSPCSKRVKLSKLLFVCKNEYASSCSNAFSFE